MSLNCRDLLDSRKWENYTSSDTFTRYQKNRRQSRNFNLTVTWNFGNMKRKDRPQNQGEQDDNDMQDSYNGVGGED